MRRTGEGPAPNGVVDDTLNRRFAVTQRAQSLQYGAVDDLEIAAAGEFFELHERKIGLDAGCIAVHNEPDGARGRDNGDLRVAEAMSLAERDYLVPSLACGGDEVLLRTGAVL